MKTVLRAVVVLVATASIALAGAAGVHAASPTPDLIGGALSATPTEVILTSKSTVTASVVMETDGQFTLTPSRFNIEPGETVTMAVTGDPTGRLSASMSVLAANVDGETSSVTLEVAFPKPAPPAFPWPLVVGVVLVIAVALSGFYGVRRVRRRYAFVVTRKES